MRRRHVIRPLSMAGTRGYAFDPFGLQRGDEDLW